MTVRVAINGYGRIGFCILRAIVENNLQNEFDIVAINDISGVDNTAHFTRYDSTHGRFNAEVKVQDSQMVVNDHPIAIISERDPLKLPWNQLEIDLVFECTGRFTEKEQALQHIQAGAKKVLISAPGKNVDATIVYGVNHESLVSTDIVVSNASCTTNCIAPVAQVIHKAVGIEYGLINTIHAYTKDQLLLDGNHGDLRRARAAAHSIIPTKTGAAVAVGLVLPELLGRLDGFAMRVPTMNVSVVDLTFIPGREVTIDEINEIMWKAKSDILHINDEPLVSCDFNHSKASAIFDVTQTKIQGNLVKVVAWYDNEWGFANRMLDTGRYMMSC